ncbi:hypothetical protein KAFR_0H01780 [Kazachstania africana CBS 2517]|uniref:Uncharacterized protein n=1 Tax=Kazachstania africana (strain ATCC 22294 / BCRC 22015 / CBS 2517 / CECT 1963 / NBRC 1671 / NRRL Y-8276) TaxID=1071382 RepID=H2AZ32_KAZAF|nr:hypothetical protein KAFR_0H01780 [Kazachstania africana CBS 2517]CCF59588.1 hypothetical protein KAFR_0H01780 [Kazachstania africana CBS 2517]
MEGNFQKRDVEEGEVTKKITASSSNATIQGAQVSSYNARLYWPDIINTPENQWTFTCTEIIEKLNTLGTANNELKKNMETCLMYFYNMKKKLNLFDHTYTASSIYFFRFWYVYGLPSSLINCIHISQAILVTACKTMENNRPIDVYVKSTCEFMLQMIPGLKNKYNMDKLKWEVRDKLVKNEKRIVCSFGFDLNIDNPKEMIEEMFSGFYRFSRDYDLSNEFQESFPKILQEARSFIIQAVTQPISLLCDGYDFVSLALIYCGVQYKRMVDNEFKFPKDFFSKRFPSKVTSEKFANFFTDYRLLEENFFDLKSNKKEKLQISKEEIDSIIQETPDEPKNEEEPESELLLTQKNLYDYNAIKSGEVKQELLDHIKVRVDALSERITNESKKRSATESTESPSKKAKV